MTLSMEIALVLIGQFATAAAVYAGIRADLARAIERANHAVEAADKAHNRIDQLMKGP